MVITDEQAQLYDNIVGALLISFHRNVETHHGYIINMDNENFEASKFLYHFLCNMHPILDREVTVDVHNWFRYCWLVLTKQIRKHSRMKNMGGRLYIGNAYRLLEEFFDEIGYKEETPWQILINDIYKAYYSLEKKK